MRVIFKDCCKYNKNHRPIEHAFQSTRSKKAVARNASPNTKELE